MSRLPRPRAFEMLPWLPTVAGVVVLAGLLVFTLVAMRPERKERALPPAPVGTPPFLGGPGVPGSGPAPTVTASPAAPTVTPTAVPTADATLASPRRPTTSPSGSRVAESPERRPPTPDLTGRYRTVQVFDGGFIGEVLVANASAAGRNWTVRLRFPSTIGPLHTFWVESAPQATLKQDGDDLVFTSGAPVGARSSVALRFQLGRQTATTTPTLCSVNGTACE